MMRWLLGVLGFFVGIGAAVGIIRVVGGEGNWVCQNGVWIAHGKLGTPKPSTICPGARWHAVSTLKLTSIAFTDAAEIPTQYGCTGQKISPPLTIAGVTSDAKSLALIVSDPDAPGETFYHWIVWNIPPQTSEIPVGSAPAGAMEGINSGGKIGYIAPCPPTGTHHYIFTLYELDSTFDLQSTAKAQGLLLAIGNHVLDEAHLTGLFHE
jgi:Raf kinase inhibitor-like YbhB/YbcL family protein